MANDENFDESNNQFRKFKGKSDERYLSGLLEFFKWTTTLAFAVVIWIGTNSQNQYYNSFWLVISIIFIIGSISTAIIGTYKILDFWNKDFQLIVSSQSMTVPFLSDISESDFNNIKLIEKKYQALKSFRPFLEFIRFKIYLISHIVILFIGIIFYLFAIFL